MGSIGYPELGGIAKFGPEVPALWVKMAPMIDALLRGAEPATMPLITVNNFQLDINLNAAERLGITVGDSLLKHAKRIIDSGDSRPR